MEQDNSIEIREAKAEDTPSLMLLIKELARYEKAEQEVTVSMEHFLDSGFGRQPVWWALVAEHTEKDTGTKTIIGFALYYIRYSTWKGQRLYLEDIIVTEEWRGKGIGTQLMDRLITTAGQRQVSGIIWQVLEWNTPAISFYRKYGASFDNEWINVTLPIKFFPEN